MPSDSHARSPAPAAPGHGLVVAGGRLHVDAHPIDEARAQQVRQATRVGTRGVQANAEAEFAHASHPRTERDLAGRLASREHDAVQEAAPARQQILELAPRAPRPECAGR